MYLLSEVYVLDAALNAGNTVMIQRDKAHSLMEFAVGKTNSKKQTKKTKQTKYLQSYISAKQD